MSARRFVTSLFTLLIISLPVYGFFERQAIFDWWRLRSYQPTVDVSKLATETTMRDSTRRLYYIYHPAIEDKASFNNACREDEQTIVLGCYVDGRGIHLLNINDPRLTGVEEVTAAHETLHAAYARLSTAKRKEVDVMTDAAFRALTDQRVKDTVELYRKHDSSVVPNELHSILGTEVRILPKNLEDYYNQYFVNRSIIVGFSEQYEQAFTERKNQIVSYDAELSSLKQQIDTLQSKLNKDSAALAQERNQLESLKASGNASAYNAGVEPFNAHVIAYNKHVDQLTSLVTQYNEIVPRRNEIASEEQELVKAIDSRETVPARQ